MVSKAGVGCGVVTVLLIVIGILIGTSFKTLAPNELGLDYSANSLTIDTDTLYSAGIHYLGVGHSWILYPKKVLEIDMRSNNELIVGRTKDGLVVELKTRLLYKLMPIKERLAALYLMFKGDYPAAYRSIARGTVRDVAAMYTAFEFWQQRDNITQVMKQALVVRLADVHADVDDFLLSSYELPVKFQQALIETDVWQQERSKVSYELETSEKEIETLILSAGVTVEKMMIAANREANTTLLGYEAESERVRVTTEAETASFGKLKADLNLTPEQLLNIVFLRSLGGTKNAKKMYNAIQPASLSF